ncbi:MAG: PilZ domain-containing protein [Desulfamplus sp.]|nr:PilZ domain-containing protein [Desulfamplus sp.]
MPIPNLLTKLIVNINRLSYEKQEELYRISEGWLTQTPVQEDQSVAEVKKPDTDTVPEVTVFEERAYERKDVMVPIEFVGGGNLYKEITKDISAGGLFIKTNKQGKFNVGQKVSMVFLINDDKKPFKLTGTIIRIESDGVAVQFRNLSAFECVAIEEELSSMKDNSLS